MEASSSTSAGGEYDRVLLRLVSTDDTKLQPVIDRLLPMVLNQLQSLPPNAPATQRTKILEIVNHILLRLRANSSLNVPVKEILDLWWKAGLTETTPSLGEKLFYNMSLVFLELGQSRIPSEGPEAEAFATDIVSGLGHVPASYQPSLAFMAFQHVGRHASRKNKPAQGIELGSIVYEMAAEFLSIPTRITSGSVPVPAAWLTGRSAESWRSALGRSKSVTRSVEDLANTKVDVIEFIGDFGRPNESYVPLLVGSVDGYDRVSRIAQSYLSRISPELKANDSILIDRVIDSSAQCPLAGIPASFLASCAQTLARGARVIADDKSKVDVVMEMVVGVLKQGSSANTQLQRSMVTLATRILEVSPEQAYALLPVLSSRIGYGSELGVLYRLVCDSIARNGGQWNAAAPLEALARLLRPSGGGNGLTSDSECAVSLAYLLLRSQAREEALRLLREAIYLRPESSIRQLAANSLLNGLANSEALRWVMAAVIRADPDAGVRDCGRQPDPALLGPRARMPISPGRLAESIQEEEGEHRRLCRADWSLEQSTSLLEFLTAACSSVVVESAEVLSDVMTSLVKKAAEGGRVHEAVEGCYVCRELPNSDEMLAALVTLGATGISERDREHAAAALTHYKDSRKIRAELIGSSDSSAICLGCEMVSGEVEPELGDRLKELALTPTTAARDNVAAYACRAIARAIKTIPVNLELVKKLEDAMTCPHRGSAVLELYGAAGARDGDVRDWVEQKCRQLIGRKDSDLKMKDAVAGCLVACGSEIPAEPMTIRALYIVHYLSDASRATKLETLMSWLDTLLASCLKEPPEDSTEQAVLGDVCIKAMVILWGRARKLDPADGGRVVYQRLNTAVIQAPMGGRKKGGGPKSEAQFMERLQFLREVMDLSSCSSVPEVCQWLAFLILDAPVSSVAVHDEVTCVDLADGILGLPEDSSEVGLITKYLPLLSQASSQRIRDASVSIKYLIDALSPNGDRHRAGLDSLRLMVQLLGNPKVAVRGAAARATGMLLREQSSSLKWGDISGIYQDIWNATVRLMDDRDERISTDVGTLGRILKSTTVRMCHECPDESLPVILPALYHTFDVYKFAQPMCLEILTSVIDSNPGTRRSNELLLTLVAPMLLTALSATEPEAFSYVQMHVSASDSQKALEFESARARAAVNDSSVGRLLKRLVPCATAEAMIKTYPAMRDLALRGTGSNTRVGVCEFWNWCASERSSIMSEELVKKIINCLGSLVGSGNAVVRVSAAQCLCTMARLPGAEQTDIDWAVARAMKHGEIMGMLVRRLGDLLSENVKAEIVGKAFVRRNLPTQNGGENQWEEMWQELCPNSKRAVVVYQKEIIQELCDTLESEQRRDVRVAAAQAATEFCRLVQDSGAKVETRVFGKLEGSLLSAMHNSTVFPGACRFLEAYCEVIVITGIGRERNIVEESITYMIRGDAEHKVGCAKALTRLLERGRNWAAADPEGVIRGAQEILKFADTTEASGMGKAFSTYHKLVIAALDLWVTVGLEIDQLGERWMHEWENGSLAIKVYLCRILPRMVAAGKVEGVACDKCVGVVRDRASDEDEVNKMKMAAKNAVEEISQQGSEPDGDVEMKHYGD